MVSCCNHSRKHKSCKRQTDKKKFKLPRRFTKSRCIKGPIKGFTMKSSCAPYHGCTMKGGKKTKSHKIPGPNFDFYLSSKLQKGKSGRMWISVMDGYIYLSGADRRWYWDLKRMNKKDSDYPSIEFNDKRQTLKINKNKRIVFKREKDYEICKSYLEKYV